MHVERDKKSHSPLQRGGKTSTYLRDLFFFMLSMTLIMNHRRPSVEDVNRREKALAESYKDHLLSVRESLLWNRYHSRLKEKSITSTWRILVVKGSIWESSNATNVLLRSIVLARLLERVLPVSDAYKYFELKALVTQKIAA